MKRLSLLALSLLCVPLSHADSPWTLKAGVSEILTQNNGGSLAGMRAATTNSFEFTPAIEYNLTPEFSAELLLAAPFQHKVSLDSVNVAKVKQLPPTLTLKYKLPAIQQLQPYVGVGVNYTLFWGEKTVGPIAGAKLQAKDSVGMAGLIGAEYRLPKSPFGIAVDVRYIDLKSDIKLNGSNIGELKINPWVVGAGLTYHMR